MGGCVVGRDTIMPRIHKYMCIWGIINHDTYTVHITTVHMYIHTSGHIYIYKHRATSRTTTTTKTIMQARNTTTMTKTMMQTMNTTTMKTTMLQTTMKMTAT